jgi:hypothetical protein
MSPTKKRSRLSIYQQANQQDGQSSCRWLIDGYPATVIFWTAEQWAILKNRPTDALPCPSGIWCALRFD